MAAYKLSKIRVGGGKKITDINPDRANPSHSRRQATDTVRGKYLSNDDTDHARLSGFVYDI